MMKLSNFKKTSQNSAGLTEAQFLRNYDVTAYERPSVTVDMVVFCVVEEPARNYRKLPVKKLHVLMVKRGDHPYMGQWALPGGFVRMDENFEEAVVRELKEETNVDNIYLEQLYTWGVVGRDPRTRVITVSYLALIDASSQIISGGSDAVEAKWFTVEMTEEEGIEPHEDVTRVTLKLNDDQEDLSSVMEKSDTVFGIISKQSLTLVSSQGIAFDHAKIIQYGLEKLRENSLRSDIVFNLMPESFTLTELQRVYEVILGQPLLMANFRRKVSHMVTLADEVKVEKSAGHRPSQLYRFNPNWKMEKLESEKDRN
jgi:ADP-ribose pyrophosphatase YjhB (NUDIX family)